MADYWKEKENIINGLQVEALRLTIKNKDFDNKGEIFRLMLEKAFYQGRIYEKNNQ